ncbi:MAG: hypothetical protein OHK0039_46500 [Bacteroidia bacterium]
MTRILFPTDFSEFAHRAMLQALPIVHRMGAELVLLNVYTIPATYAEAPAMVLGEEVERQHRLAVGHLNRYADEIRAQYPDLPVRSIAVMGGIVHEILETARTEQVDGIIMATLGASGLKKVLIGSHAASVVSHAHVPVLLLPAQAVHIDIRRILYATNYADQDQVALRQVLGLARLFEAEVDIVHIAAHDSPEEVAAFSDYCDRITVELEAPGLNFRMILSENVQEGLAELLDAGEYDILAMSPRRRSLLNRLFQRSETLEMAYHPVKPLLAC